MDMQSVLSTFKVTDASLSADQLDQLDELGYLPLPGLLSAAQVAAFRERVEAITGAEGARAGIEVSQEAGANRLSNLADKDPLFDLCYTHPSILAAMNHVLQSDFKLSSLNSRASLPGEGLQALHADWGGGGGAGRLPGLQFDLAIGRFHRRKRRHTDCPGFAQKRPIPRRGSRRSLGEAPRRNPADRASRHGCDI